MFTLLCPGYACSEIRTTKKERLRKQTEDRKPYLGRSTIHPTSPPPLKTSTTRKTTAREREEAKAINPLIGEEDPHVSRTTQLQVGKPVLGKRNSKESAGGTSPYMYRGMKIYTHTPEVPKGHCK